MGLNDSGGGKLEYFGGEVLIVKFSKCLESFFWRYFRIFLMFYFRVRRFCKVLEYFFIKM